jgi:uncharacterized protein YprB with RNaseH-like and TPR domain
LSDPQDRIRRILSDGLPQMPPRDRGVPRLRPVTPEETSAEPQEAGVGSRLSPELRARLHALGVGLGRPSAARKDEEARRHDAAIGPTPATPGLPPAEPEPVAGALPPPSLGDLEDGAPLDQWPLGRWVGGVERETPVGTLLYVERHYPLDAMHGGQTLRTGTEFGIPLRPHERHPRDRAVDGPPPMLQARDAIFIDTETTGLSGGTGTVAFLVGTGQVVGEHFVVRQYCMRDYPEEDALLHALAADIGEDPLVSFNGRGFDWPLLTTRFRLHRQEPAPRAHLDLLPPARRLWARTLHSHGLAALERHVLGLERGEDLPGWRIPAAFFEYLRSGEAGTIAQAFRHNAIDVVSMLTLFAHIARTLDDPIRRVARPGDQLGTARLLLDLGQPDQARRCLEAGLSECPDGEGLTLERLLGRLCKQAGDHEAALAHWMRVADQAAGFDVEAYEQAAKINEHGLRRFDIALDWTRRALERCVPESAAAAAFAHRAARLERRLHSLT